MISLNTLLNFDLLLHIKTFFDDDDDNTILQLLYCTKQLNNFKNKICKFTVLQKQYFNSVPHIKDKMLSCTHIKFISTGIINENKYIIFENLVDLSLSNVQNLCGNNLKTLKKLKILSLNKCILCNHDEDTFTNLSELHILHCNFNDIKLQLHKTQIKKLSIEVSPYNISYPLCVNYLLLSNIFKLCMNDLKILTKLIQLNLNCCDLYDYDENTFTNLLELHMYQCEFKNINFQLHKTQIKKLSFRSCFNINISFPLHLEYLKIFDCDTFNCLKLDEPQQYVHKLNISYCKNLSEIFLSSNNTVCIDNCISLTKLELSYNTNKVDIINSNNLDIYNLKYYNLTSLKLIEYNNYNGNTLNLTAFECLTTLEIKKCKFIEYIFGINKITTLRLCNCPKIIKNITDILYENSCLKVLDFTNNVDITNLTLCGNFKHLKYIYLNECTNIKILDLNCFDNLLNIYTTGTKIKYFFDQNNVNGKLLISQKRKNINSTTLNITSHKRPKIDFTYLNTTIYCTK